MLLLATMPVAFAVPNPGHRVQNISGGTFSDDDGDFVYPNTVDVDVLGQLGAGTTHDDTRGVNAVGTAYGVYGSGTGAGATGLYGTGGAAGTGVHGTGQITGVEGTDGTATGRLGYDSGAVEYGVYGTAGGVGTGIYGTGTTAGVYSDGHLHSTGTAEIEDVTTLSGGAIGATPVTQLVFANVYDNAGDPSPNKIQFWGNANDKFGIGISSGDFDFFSQNNYRWNRYQGAAVTSDLMTLTSAGRLGVGNAVPGYTLDVTGNGRVTTQLGVGAVPNANTAVYGTGVATGVYGSGTSYGLYTDGNARAVGDISLDGQIYDITDGEVSVNDDLYVIGGRVTGSNSEYISLGEVDNQIDLVSNGAVRATVDTSNNFGVQGMLYDTDGDLYIDDNVRMESYSMYFNDNDNSHGVQMVHSAANGYLNFAQSGTVNGYIYIQNSIDAVYMYPVNMLVGINAYTHTQFGDDNTYANDVDFYLDDGATYREIGIWSQAVEVGQIATTAADVLQINNPTADIHLQPGGNNVGIEGNIYDITDGELTINDDAYVVGGRVTGANSEYIALGEAADNQIDLVSNGAVRARVDTANNFGVEGQIYDISGPTLEVNDDAYVIGGNLGVGAAPSANSAVYATGVATGVYGFGTTEGVRGASTATGVYGGGNTYGVVGDDSDGSGYGYLGNGDNGVYGAGNSIGVQGIDLDSASEGRLGNGVTGVYGVGGAAGTGVYGSGATYGVYSTGNLGTNADAIIGDDIDFDGELMPDGALCAANQILMKIGADDWDCVSKSSCSGADEVEISGVCRTIPDCDATISVLNYDITTDTFTCAVDCGDSGACTTIYMSTDTSFTRTSATQISTGADDDLYVQGGNLGVGAAPSANTAVYATGVTTGVYGAGTGVGIYGQFNANNFGYLGANNQGVGGQGVVTGVQGTGTGAAGIGVEGNGVSIGVGGTGQTGVSGQGTTYGGYFVDTLGGDTGVYAEGDTGVYGIGTGYGGYFEKTGGGGTVVYARGSGAEAATGVYGAGTIGLTGQGMGAGSTGVLGAGRTYGAYGIGTMAAGGSTGILGSGESYGVWSGIADGSTPITGVYADGTSYSLYGASAVTSVYGVGTSYGGYFQGGAAGSGTGVYGDGEDYGGYFEDSNTGVYSEGTDIGVYGSATTVGVLGADGTAIGRLGYGNFGVHGSGNSYGVYGEGTLYGVYGEDLTTGSNGHLGFGDKGVVGSGTTGIYTTFGTYGLYAIGGPTAVYANGATGVYAGGSTYGSYNYGDNIGATGVYGEGDGYGGYFYGSTADTALYAGNIGGGIADYGIWADGIQTGIFGFGFSQGLSGSAWNDAGVYGINSLHGGEGRLGYYDGSFTYGTYASGQTAIYGSGTNYGGYFIGPDGVRGISTSNSVGVYGNGGTGTGIYGFGSVGVYSEGNIYSTGSILAQGHIDAWGTVTGASLVGNHNSGSVSLPNVAGSTVTGFDIGDSGTFWNAGTNTALCFSGAGPQWVRDCNGAPSDYAEWYRVAADKDIESGMIVMAIEETDTAFGKDFAVSPSKTGHNPIGIVSTSPNFIIGEDVMPEAVHNSAGPLVKHEGKQYAAIALAGRVPVKVTDENGKIEVGDMLTVSDTKEGYAMRLDPSESGVVIGKALETLKQDKDSIIVFLEPGSYTAPKDKEIALLKDSVKQQQDQIDTLKGLVCLDHPEAEVCN